MAIIALVIVSPLFLLFVASLGSPIAFRSWLIWAAFVPSGYRIPRYRTTATSPLWRARFRWGAT